jgi:hypothetical protein
MPRPQRSWSGLRGATAPRDSVYDEAGRAFEPPRVAGSLSINAAGFGCAPRSDKQWDLRSTLLVTTPQRSAIRLSTPFSDDSVLRLTGRLGFHREMSNDA